jgi:hypothetical protein
MISNLKIKNSFNFLLQNSFPVFIPLSIAVGLIFLLLRDYRLEILDYSMEIGIATFRDVDIQKRISIFYCCTALFISSFLFSSALLNFLFLKRPFLRTILFKYQYLFTAFIILTFFSLINNPQEECTNILLVLIINLILFISFSNKETQIEDPFFQLNVIALSSAILISTLSAAIPFPICFLIFFGVYLAGFRLIGDKIFHPILYYFPFILVFAKIIFFILDSHDIHIIGSKALSLIITLLLAGMLFLTRKTSYFKNSTIHVYFFLLGFCFIMNFYESVISNNELFEPANTVNTMMNWFSFHRIPFIQQFNSHEISDYNLAPLYALLNGYENNFSFNLYNGLFYDILTVTGFWYFSKIISDKLFLFVLFMLLPVTMVISGNQLILFILIYALIQFINASTLKNFILLVLVQALVLLFRLDIGIACVSATGSIIILLFLTNKFSCSRKQLIIWCGATLILFAGIYGLTILKFPETPGNILLVYDYIKSAQAHGFRDIYNEFGARFINYYFVFTLIVAVSTIYFSIKVISSASVKILPFTILFLNIDFIFNFQRFLVRHSLIEGDWQFDWLHHAIFLLTLYYFVRNLQHKFSILIIVLLVFEFNFTIGFLENKPKALAENIPSRSRDFRFYSKKETNIIHAQIDTEFYNKEIKGVVSFLNSNLKKEETFIECAYNPTLYFFAQKEVPGYFNQFLQNLVTPRMVQKTVEGFKKYKIPYCVYSNIKHGKSESIDEIPNEIRYFDLYQYLFEEYKPYTIAGNYFIWNKKSSSETDPVNARSADSIGKQIELYDLMKYPKFLYQKSPERKETLPLVKTNDSTFIFRNSFKTRRYNYINIFAKNLFPAQAERYITLSYYKDQQLLGSYKMIVFAKKNISNNGYKIPISAQYNWYQYIANKIIVTTDNDQVRIEKLSLEIDR